jgi:hypothetical protein
LAAANILVAMAGFAAFVLFFERPMNNASFWIMLAVAQRLAETSRVPSVGAPDRSIARTVPARSENFGDRLLPRTIEDLKRSSERTRDS